MSENPRIRRLADRIKVIVSEAIDRGVKDPRLGFVTVTEVRLTGDAQNATIFYTVYGSDEDRDETGAALKSATGFLRTEVSRRLSIRQAPTLEFVLDAIPENADQIAKLLHEARQRDEALKVQQSSATFAGEADPYQKPRAIAEDSIEDGSVDDVGDDLENVEDEDFDEDDIEY